METWGANRVNSWCAQIGPGGRPSMGPVSPGVTPSSAGFNTCWVWLAWAVGAIQGCDRVPRQDIEARHRLRERLDAEQRAAREARRNARIRAADERIQAMLPEQQSARGE